MATIASTVGQLRKLLADNTLDDDTPILTYGPDHSYDRATVRVSFAAHDKKARRWCEYHGDEHLEAGEEKVDALVVG